MKHLLHCLLDADGLTAVDRAVKNIIDYGVNKRLQKTCGELKIYGQKTIKEMAIVQKDYSASESQSDE